LFIIFTVLVVVPGTSAAEPESLERFAWMSGHWAAEEHGRWTEEHWLEPRGGLMLGVNRSGSGGAARAFEFLRIQAAENGSVTYWAAPGGRSAVPFRLSEQSEKSATFENADNDFPQRIYYERQGDALEVTISDASGERAVRWRWMLCVQPRCIIPHRQESR